MSDGLTDVARDEEQTELIGEFLRELSDYIKSPSGEGFASLENSAKKADAVSSGYWTSQTDLTDGLKEKTELLLANDEEAWLQILELAFMHSAYNKLKAISPFSKRIVFFVQLHPNGYTATVSGDIWDLARNEFRKVEGSSLSSTALCAIISRKPKVVLVRRKGKKD